jgi:hypothetical protein
VPDNALLARLRGGIASSAELERALGASQSWVTRALRQLVKDGQVLRIGSTRGARYASRRDIDDIGSQWPLQRVDPTGEIQEIGALYSLAAAQYFFEPNQKALAAGFAWSGVSEGIPYFLQDQRPGGFLGRAVPLRYPELNLPQRVVDWTDDHYLRYLTQRGADTVGDLILGKEALNNYLSGLRSRPSIQSAQRRIRYPELAAEVMQGGLPGSSTHGEHPKFTCLLRDTNGPRHVIVKFSPPMDTPSGRRWGDLLIAEHHAHDTLLGAGLPACTSQVFTFGNRMYLEVDRFDREGIEGRRGVTSLWAIDTAQYGKLDNWIAAAARLQRDRRIDATTLEQVRLAATFGALIANTDRHFGNLAFYDRYDGEYRLAPIYDMLPMLYAPEHEQIPVRAFNPPDPNSDTVPCWEEARSLAEQYWRSLTQDLRISAEFRGISATSLQILEALARIGGYQNPA